MRVSPYNVFLSPSSALQPFLTFSAFPTFAPFAASLQLGFVPVTFVLLRCSAWRARLRDLVFYLFELHLHIGESVVERFDRLVHESEQVKAIGTAGLIVLTHVGLRRVALAVCEAMASTAAMRSWRIA